MRTSHEALLAGLLLLALALPQIAQAGMYDEFVTLDPDTHYFRNADGPFIGFGMNYNQIIDGKMSHSPSRYDPDVMAADLRQLKRLGFTHLSLRFNWGPLSREESKEEALAGWDRLLDLVEEYGLYVEIWFDPLNSWPAEVEGKHRYDTVFRERNWKLYLDWVGEMFERFKDRKSILGWRSENESLPVQAAARRGNDPELLAHYVKALKAHYGTIERVNEAWGTAHTGFGDVALPSKDDEGSAMLIDYNILFHEPFVIERNRELARVFHERNPNHLLIVSGISAVGGWVGFLFEIHDVDKLEAFDICGNGLYGNFHPQGTGSLLHHNRTMRKFMSLGKPAMITEVGIEVGPEAASRRTQRDWILANFADAVGAGGTAMDIWAYTSITQADGNYRSMDNLTGHGLGEFINGVKGAVFDQEEAKTLIVRTKAEDYGYWPWRCQGNAMMVGDFLYQMHVPYDVMTDANLTAERLSKYSFVFIPSQSVLIAEDVWQLIDSWIRSGRDRGLAVGYFSPVSRELKPASVPDTMAGLMGLDRDEPYETIDIGNDTMTLAFGFERSFGPFNQRDELTFRYGGYDSIWAMPRKWADTARVVAMLRGTGSGKTPLLVENRLPNGSRIYSLGIRLGLVSWSLGLNQPAFDNLVPLYGEMLTRAGVQSHYDAPHNLGVYISRDNDAVIVKERLGMATRELVRSERFGDALYTGASMTFSKGEPTLLSADLPPRGVKVFRRAPVRVTQCAETATVSLIEHNSITTELAVSSQDAVTLEIGGLSPDTKYLSTSAESAERSVVSESLDSDPEGRIVLDVGPSEKVFVRLEKQKK